MKTLKTIIAGAALGGILTLATTANATIIGSGHDFTSSGGWGTTLNIATFKWGGANSTTNSIDYYENPCQVCHIPHKAPSYSVANAPLWNHAITNNTAGYTLYDQAGSPSFAAVYGSTKPVLGASLACLSCHDGALAVNQSYGKTTANGPTGSVLTNIPSFAVETTVPGTKFTSGSYGSSDLTHMHPLGVNYATAVSKLPGEYNDLSADALGQRMFRAGPTVECCTCHDIHETIGNSGKDQFDHALIVTLDGGALCLMCHNK